MKMYTSQPRKPMMYGGGTRMKRNQGSTDQGEKKAKADAMANAETQSRVATGKATPKDKAAMEKQRLEDLGRMSISELRKIASGPMSDDDAMLARIVLREKGDKAAMPSGDKQPTN